MPASEKTALEAVMEADEERIKLEKLAEELATLEDEESQDYLMEVRLLETLYSRFGSVAVLSVADPGKCKNNIKF